MNRSDFGPGRLPENQPLVGEGYTIMDLPGFGLCDPDTGVSLYPGGIFGDDVHAISIGPESDCDAVIIESRSFNKGYMVVTTKAPWYGYVKGPFKVTPVYKNFSGQFEIPPANGFDGTYTAQVIMWTKPPVALFPLCRAPKRFEVHDYASLAPGDWWTIGNASVAMACFGRKYLKVQVVSDADGALDKLFGLNISSYIFAQRPGGVNGGFSFVNITSPRTGTTAQSVPSDDQNWSDVLLDGTGENSEMPLYYEAIIELSQITRFYPVGADTDYISLPRKQRVDIPVVNIYSLDDTAPTAPAATIDLYLTAYDE